MSTVTVMQQTYVILNADNLLVMGCNWTGEVLILMAASKTEGIVGQYTARSRCLHNHTNRALLPETFTEQSGKTATATTYLAEQN